MHCTFDSFDIHSISISFLAFLRSSGIQIGRVMNRSFTSGLRGTASQTRQSVDMSKESKASSIYTVGPNTKYSNYIELGIKCLNYNRIQFRPSNYNKLRIKTSN